MALISQISYEPAFLKGLLDKLKVGNRRGIHLNALPGQHRSRIDLKDFDCIREGMAEAFFNQLVTEATFSFQVDFEGIDMTGLSERDKNRLFLLARRLNNIVYDDEDQYLEYGVRNFSLGYPLLIRRERADPTKVTKAPLILWSLKIEKSPRKMNCWTISREEGAPVVLNELLRSHIASDSQINLERLPDDVLDDGIIGLDEISTIAGDILRQLNITQPDKKALKPKVIACPAKDRIEALAIDDACIQWSGIFGLYRARKEPIIKRTEEIVSKLAEFQEDKLELEDFQKSTASAVSTDPSKEEIIRSLTKTEVKVIQGPPGTGKSQALSAIITNTLENGGKCLVVCEKRTALEVVQRNLAKIGLDDYVVLIEDVNRDRSSVVGKARVRAESMGKLAIQNTEFDALNDRYERLKNQLGHRNAALVEKVLGDFNWNDLVGLFIHHSRRTESPLENVGHDKCKYTKAEYETLVERLTEGAILFKATDVTTLTALAKLKDSLFKSAYSRVAFDALSSFVQIRLKGLQEAATTLDTLPSIPVEVAATLGTDKALTESILSLEATEAVLRQCSETISSLTSTASDKSIFIQIDFKDKLQSLVFAKAKVVRAAKERFQKEAGEYESMRSKFAEEAQLPILPAEGKITLAEISEAIGKAQERTGELLSAMRAMHDLVERIKEHNRAVLDIPDLWTTRVHPLFEKPFEIKSYQTKLAKELEYFIDLQKQLRDYQPFHEWRYFLSQISTFERSVMTKLLKHDPTTWVDAGKTWYLYGLLGNKEGDIPGTPDRTLDELISLLSQLKEAQIRKIKSIWNLRAWSSKERLEQEMAFNLLYNLRKNRAFNKTLSLRQIIEKDLGMFTSTFPVILTSPMVADSILPLKQGMFEVVVFDEASQLRIEDTFTSFIRGQFKVVAGDEHQMPPSSYFEGAGEISDDGERENDDEDGAPISTINVQQELANSISLLDYALNLPQISRSYLDYHYRSQHPALIEFSNAAFYGTNLVAFPETVSYTPIDFRQVDGTYSENMNMKEIQEVIRILREDIRENAKGIWPSVGIATFNLKQRNGIIDALNEVSAQDAEFARTLEEIKKSGFFVKNLENIQGDEMDVIIISTTFGKDKTGRFFERFGPVNQERGYKLLNVLVTRARDKIFVCTSIPATKYRSYATQIESDGGNHRKARLYAYLAYADAVSSHKAVEVESVLRTLSENSHDQKRSAENAGLVESPFEQEVYEILLEVFDELTIQPQVKAGGFRIDFVLTLPTGHKVAIECDGKTYHSSNEAYAHDTFRQTELEHMGYTVYHIWSTKWWQDHEQEKRKFVDFVQKLK
jgi:very-short-patch-repair endonuclease